ncbi:T9SS type B sorting domain-containing protein [Mucilaginibacter terrigena]|uniref:T9SS type B sorting domain-containing protein n=1 Tax=Mucilaginibacter terrigena TaxID=2492395 RepID=A0A4Q5LQD0_9SPHI|nr:cadherin-like beta sandwich domain-containing protein [Mucilaginibacter terrigena]RYU91634.1 T9SS type B sorting domain-containing protein [Mucilaginibacter terrigena]
MKKSLRNSFSCLSKAGRVLIVCYVMLLAAFSNANAQSVYFMTSDGVAASAGTDDALYVIAADGSVTTKIAGSITASPGVMKVDILHDVAYFTDDAAATYAIKKVDLNTGTITSVLSAGISFPITSIDYNPENNNIYYVTADPAGQNTNTALWRVQADGSNNVKIAGSIDTKPGPMTLDFTNNRAIYGNQELTNAYIKSINLSTGAITTISPSSMTGPPTGTVYSLQKDAIYVLASDRQIGGGVNAVKPADALFVMLSNGEGGYNSPVGNIGSSVAAAPVALAIDLANGVAYFTDAKAGNYAVKKVALTGGAVTTLSTQSFIVKDVDITNSAPFATIEGTNQTYTENAAAVQVSPAAIAGDEDGNWSGGTFTASVSSNSESADVLTIGTATGLSVSGGILSDGATAFGTVSTSDGTVTGSTTLTVTFNDNATNARIQKLMRAITFKNPGETFSTTARVVTLALADSKGATVSKTRSVTMVLVNDAPVLSGGPYTFASTSINVASPATMVSSILDALTYTDSDATTSKGIAVTITSGTGTWQYSTNGTTWSSVGSVSVASALLLSPTTYIRYIGGASAETASILFRGWDQSSGTASTNVARSLANPSSANGGTTAFSAGMETGNLAVLALTAQNITFNALPAKTYGDADFAPGATSDNNSVDITYSSDNPAVATIVSGNIHIVGAGSANITASQAADATHSAAADAVQALTVDPAALTIKADDQTKVYGAAMPALTVQYTGFVNGDDESTLTTPPVVSSAGDETSHVAGSPYAITASGAANANYAISYTAGALTVTTAPLSIKADDLTKVYGDALPTLTVSYTGLVNGDTGASLTTPPVVNTMATSATHVLEGPVQITASGAVDTDYAITYTDGALTIDKAPLTITADDLTKLYGAAVPILTASYTGFVNSDTEANLTTLPTLTTTATAASGLGPYPITAADAAADDYAINYVAGTLTVEPKTDATLSNLTTTANGFAPAFDSNVTTGYTASVPNTTTSVTVTPTTNDADISNLLVRVNGGSFNAVTSGNPSPSLPLNVGNNTIDVQVTAQDGTTDKTYTLTVNRGASTDATLTTIATSPQTKLVLVPGTNFRDYTTTVKSTATPISIIANTREATATITVNGVAVVSGAVSTPVTLNADTTTIYTTVTAGDGVTKKTYAVVVSQRASTVATLATIRITPTGKLTRVTGVNYADYTTTVANATRSLSVTADAQDETSTITVNGVAVNSGVLSAPVVLNADTTTIYTTVTAQNGATKKTYAILVTRLPSTDATLAAIQTSPSSKLTLATGTNFRDYTTTIKSTITSVSINATVRESTATITVNGVAVNSGVVSSPVTLNADTTTIYTTVTAGDGTTKKTYAILVTRQPSNVATLASITTTPTSTLTRVTGPNYVDYATTVANATNSLKITATAQQPAAKITVNGAPVSSGVLSGAVVLNSDTTTIFTTVTAEDGTTKKTYAILVTRQAAPSGFAANFARRDAVNDIIVHQNVSPNGDGQGDAMHIEGITAYPDNKLQIINRNGNLVYEARGYDNANKTFDGHASNGKLQQPGTYFYSLEYKVGKETKRKTGYIVLKY